MRPATPRRRKSEQTLKIGRKEECLLLNQRIVFRLFAEGRASIQASMRCSFIVEMCTTSELHFESTTS